MRKSAALLGTLAILATGVFATPASSAPRRGHDRSRDITVDVKHCENRAHNMAISMQALLLGTNRRANSYRINRTACSGTAATWVLEKPPAEPCGTCHPRRAPKPRLVCYWRALAVYSYNSQIKVRWSPIMSTTNIWLDPCHKWPT